MNPLDTAPSHAKMEAKVMDNIKTAIEALEIGLKDFVICGNFATIPAMKDALAALRSIKPATEEEIIKSVGLPLSSREVNAWRQCERHHGIGGE